MTIHAGIRASCAPVQAPADGSRFELSLSGGVAGVPRRRGRSYGGVVITEAGTDPKVAALVYVAAFAPDANESVAKLVPPPAPDAPPSPILAPVDGFLSIDKTAFPAAFAADVDPQVARFMADSQVPWGVRAFAGRVTLPAWKSRPSWYLIPKDDRIIPPTAQQAMAGRAHAKIQEAAGSHAIYVADPKATATVIEEAAAAIAYPLRQSRNCGEAEAVIGDYAR